MVDIEKSIAIGIPTSGNIHWRFAADLMGLQLPMSTRVLWQVRTMIDTARNKLVEKMLEDIGATHIFMVDDDMTFQPDALKKLMAHDVDIVGTLAFKRTPNFEPCVYKLKEGTDDHYPILPAKFEEVDAVGTGGILIKREVFEKIKNPWFETWYAKDGSGKHWGVDIDFCKKAKAAGFKIHVDPEVELGHIGEAPIITKQTFLHVYNNQQQNNASIKSNSNGTSENG